AHGRVERAARAAPDVGEGVEEEDDVCVPLWMLLVDPERVPSRARAPVDAAEPVAGLPLPEIRELDPLGPRARRLVADEDLRLERRDERPQRLRRRVHAQRLPRPEGRLPAVKA